MRNIHTRFFLVLSELVIRLSSLYQKLLAEKVCVTQATSEDLSYQTRLYFLVPRHFVLRSWRHTFALCCGVQTQVFAQSSFNSISKKPVATPLRHESIRLVKQRDHKRMFILLSRLAFLLLVFDLRLDLIFFGVSICYLIQLCNVFPGRLIIPATSHPLLHTGPKVKAPTPTPTPFFRAKLLIS